jgi:hypothetical protein
MSHNFHEDLSRPLVVRRSSDRSLGFALTILLFTVGIWPLLRHDHVRVWALLASAAILLVALMRPALLSHLARASTALGLLLGRITSPIVTTALFFIVFAPVGWIVRLLGRDPLHLDHAAKATSYWITRTPPGPRPESMSKQF